MGRLLCRHHHFISTLISHIPTAKYNSTPCYVLSYWPRRSDLKGKSDLRPLDIPAYFWESKPLGISVPWGRLHHWRNDEKFTFPWSTDSTAQSLSSTRNTLWHSQYIIASYAWKIEIKYLKNLLPVGPPPLKLWLVRNQCPLCLERNSLYSVRRET